MPIINTVIQGGGTTAPAHYIEKLKNASGKMTNGSTFINMDNILDLDSRVLRGAYYYNSSIAGIINMSSLTACSGSEACANMCEQSTNITGVNLSSLVSVSGQSAFDGAFKGCSGITSVDLSSLETVSGYAAFQATFNNCTGLTGVSLPVLTTISGGLGCQTMFFGCSHLASATFPSLKTISGSQGCRNMFMNCTALTSLSFPALNTVLNSSVFSTMLNGVTGCTVHFPSNLSTYNFDCGGTNTTILYDLPATVVLTGANSTNYERNPKDDTAAALAWRVGTAYNTSYYTSGTTDPQVGDTIYSDSACTTAVTTISAIA